MESGMSLLASGPETTYYYYIHYSNIIYIERTFHDFFQAFNEVLKIPNIWLV